MLGASSSLGGCKVSTPQTAAVKIAGGTETAAYPAVRHFEVDSARGRVCTAVAVSPNTALMAGHCIKKTTLETGVVDVETKKKSFKIYAWLALKGVETMDEAHAARDLAVVVFADRIFEGTYLPVSISGPVSKEVTIVGYGADGFDGLNNIVRASRGKKRVGTNRIAQVREGLLTLQADVNAIGPANAVATIGDSGGPMIDARGAVVGLGAAIYLLNAQGQMAPLTTDAEGYKIPVAAGAAKAFNAFVDLSTTASQRLLRFAVREGFAVIPGIAADTAPLDLADQAWTLESTVSDFGPMVAMCGGGGGGGAGPGTSGGGNYGNDDTGGGNYGNGDIGGGTDYTGNQGNEAGAYDDTIATGSIGNKPGTTSTSGAAGSSGQFGGPSGDPRVAGKAAYDATCANVGCHASKPHDAGALGKQAAISQVNSPSGSMASVRLTPEQKTAILAYLNTL